MNILYVSLILSMYVCVYMYLSLVGMSVVDVVSSWQPHDLDKRGREEEGGREGGRREGGREGGREGEGGRGRREGDTSGVNWNHTTYNTSSVNI